MIPLSITSVFCEDIREETGGTVTLVGIMPDNVNIELPKEGQLGLATNKILAKLCIYIRLGFDPNTVLDEIKLRLTLPDGTQVSLGSADPSVLKAAGQQARERKIPIAGVISRAVLGGFSLQKLGVMTLEAIMPHETRVIGAINFLPAPTESVKTSSTAQ